MRANYTDAAGSTQEQVSAKPAPAVLLPFTKTVKQQGNANAPPPRINRLIIIAYHADIIIRNQMHHLILLNTRVLKLIHHHIPVAVLVHRNACSGFKFSVFIRMQSIAQKMRKKYGIE